jgi:hypothetical protein
MYIKYGSHAHASGECQVAISRQGLRSEHGVLYAIRETWTITGMLLGSVSELTTAIAALEAAYAADGYDLALYADGGTATAHALTAANTIGGTRVVQRPHYPIGAGAEYATYRTYNLVVEGDVSVSAGLLTFNEQITFAGGGMDWGFLPVLNGPPQKQIFREQTTYKAQQVGHATHASQYPSPADPIWPAAEHLPLRQIAYHGPMRVGLTGSQNFVGYGVQWSYAFEDVAALVGAPHLWG